MWSAIPLRYLFLIILIAIAYYLYVASTVKIGKERIRDIIVIAIILWLSSLISSYTKFNALSIAGFLVFAYGWVILVIQKFKEGLNDDKS